MQMSDQIIAVLDNLTQKFGVAIDWGQQNIIPYIQQLCANYITWEISSSIVWICVCAIIAFIGVVFFKYVKKRSNGIDRDLLIAITIFCWAILLSVAVYQVFDIVRCLTFPELQILEYIKKLLSNN